MIYDTLNNLPNYFDYASVDALAFRSHQRNYGAFHYAFAIEFAFYLEDVFGHATRPPAAGGTAFLFITSIR